MAVAAGKVLQVTYNHGYESVPQPLVDVALPSGPAVSREPDRTAAAPYRGY